MLKDNKYLIGAMLAYALPILLFGDFKYQFMYVVFICSLPIIFYRLKKGFKKEHISNIVTYLICSFLLSTFKLFGFSLEITKNILGISLKWGNVVGFWVGYTLFFILHDKHKFYVKKKLMLEFDNDETRIDRDKKIDTILGKWLS